jgi:hypothetical protein
MYFLLFLQEIETWTILHSMKSSSQYTNLVFGISISFSNCSSISFVIDYQFSKFSRTREIRSSISIWNGTAQYGYFDIGEFEC